MAARIERRESQLRAGARSRRIVGSLDIVVSHDLNGVSHTHESSVERRERKGKGRRVLIAGTP